MKNVKINAKLVITWLGGRLPAPIACLVSDKTTTSLIKLVVIIKILGASVKIVNQIRICKPFVKSCGVFAVPNPMFIFGNVIAAFDGIIENKNSPKAPPHFFIPDNFIMFPLKIDYTSIIC